MIDPRYTKLAKLLVNYSTALKKGDRILLDMVDVPDEFTVELVRAVRAAGATPLVEVRHSRVTRELLLGATEAQAIDIRDLELVRMKKVQAYIALRGAANMNETSDVPSDRMQMYSKSHPAGPGLSDQQDALVCAALAHSQHGAGSGHEHRGV